MLGKKVAGILAATTLAFTALTLTAAPAGAVSSEEGRFISKINQERSSRGIHSLATYNDLVTVARRHSQRMADKGTIWHNDNLGREVSGWTVIGENVGMGGTVNDLHQAFMNSPGHRANILDREYNQVGVGVVIKSGTIYVTAVFVQRASTAAAPRPRVSAPRTTTTPRTITARSTAPAPTRPAARAAARPAAPKPVPVAAPRTVSLLVQLVGLDAKDVDPSTGQAIGL